MTDPQADHGRVHIGPTGRVGRIAVTGAAGFLGWHVRCAAFARGIDTVPVGRAALADPDRMAGLLRGVDAVVHCAGVNRGTDAEILDGNLRAARLLAAAVDRIDRPVRTVYANSVHRSLDTPYGRAKAGAATVLSRGPAADHFSDVVLPNLFGEHGVPHYNSFVATFCHELVSGRMPTVLHDREIPLMHAQDAAEVLLQETGAVGRRVVEPKAQPLGVSTVLGLLRDIDATYRHGQLPDLTEPLRLRLFHTYRSYLFPTRQPIVLSPKTDDRGTLVECVRSGTTGGQGFVSSTRPGAVRGEHVHLRKFERFMVFSGTAEIALRRLFTTAVVRFRVSGERPVAVDIPTLWAHNLTNMDSGPVTTFFWSNELYSADDPDTFACPVDGTSEGSPDPT